MACPRVFFDVTAGGQPVGRVIMEVSLLMFRRNLTNFLKDKSRWPLESTPCFCRFSSIFYFENHEIWCSGCVSHFLQPLRAKVFVDILSIYLSFRRNLTSFVCKSCWALEATPCFCRFF